MRGTVDMAGLVLIAIGVLAIVVQVQNVGGDAYDALKLRTKANVFIEVNDQTGKFMPILNTRKGQLSHSEMFACMISGARFCGDDSLVEEITRDMNARLIVYDHDNKEIETYGKRDIGDKLFVDIPLPDGKRGRIAVIVERTREKGTIKDIVTAYGDCMKIVEVADSFIGCGYDLGAPRCSMPEKGTCLQENGQVCLSDCGSFVSSVFKVILGYELDESHLNGNDRCNGDNMRIIGTDVDILQPGDVFAANGLTSSAGRKYGHTGIYVGRGYVENELKSNCFSEFKPNPDGEPVFIHSSGPVCYSTYSRMFDPGRPWELITFCRQKGVECTQVSSGVSVMNDGEETSEGVTG